MKTHRDCFEVIGTATVAQSVQVAVELKSIKRFLNATPFAWRDGPGIRLRLTRRRVVGERRRSESVCPELNMFVRFAENKSVAKAPFGKCRRGHFITIEEQTEIVVCECLPRDLFGGLPRGESITHQARGDLVYQDLGENERLGVEEGVVQ